MSDSLIPDTLSTIGSWARFIAQGLEASGVDSRQLFTDAGIDLSEVDNPNRRFPVENMSRVWKLAVERTADPCFPLALAATASPGIYSGLGLSIISSKTLREAINRTCRFSRVASDAADVVLRELDEERVELALEQSPTQAAAVTAESMEAFMATAVHIFRSSSHEDFRPLEVHFRHNRETYRERYESFFCAPVLFASEKYSIIFSRSALDFPCDQSNPELAESIDAWMSDYLSKFESHSLSLKVRKLLREKLPDGEFNQNDVASNLAMSSRSLQRRLQKEGVSFKELLEETRQDLAMKYISEKQLSLIEICCMLGFSDQSNFTKAFKRWTGQTPHSYRQGLMA